MLESEAKTKLCPHMPHRITHTGSEAGLCHGSRCMMWEHEYKREKMDIQVDMDGAPTPPPQEYFEQYVPDGWYYTTYNRTDKTIRVVRYVPIDRGDCGLKSKETGCSYDG